VNPVLCFPTIVRNQSIISFFISECGMRCKNEKKSPEYSS
jgi:hypothetical protein